MPNFELHGCSPRITEAKGLIKQVVADLGLQKDAVLTMAGDNVTSLDDGKDASFLRLWVTGQREAIPIIEALKKAGLGMDCEVALLDEFIPADKMAI